jgi:hypothetical protein
MAMVPVESGGECVGIFNQLQDFCLAFLGPYFQALVILLNSSSENPYNSMAALFTSRNRKVSSS